MDALAVKQACKFAKEHALKNGPIVSLHNTFFICQQVLQLLEVFFSFFALFADSIFSLKSNLISMTL